MKRFIFSLWLILFFIPTLPAEHIDPSISSFELRERKYRVDVFDFTGEYTLLENIDIDARRKKRVEMFLTGAYPLLEKINYEGSFGSVIGKLTGSFPKLAIVNFLCSSAAMQLDLSGDWKQNCEINIKGSTGNIIVTLPKGVGVTVNTKTGTTGKVINNNGYQKKGWGWLNRTYVNDHSMNAPVQLTINIEVTKAKITLN